LIDKVLFRTGKVNACLMFGRPAGKRDSVPRSGNSAY
jgi:hypothetical protein